MRVFGIELETPLERPLMRMTVMLVLNQAGLLLLVAVMLVMRTYADVWMIQNGTAIEG